MSVIVVAADTKGVGADLDYTLDYGQNWLAVGDTIKTSNWAVLGGDGGLVLHDGVTGTTTATIWAKAGTSGQTYTLVNTIVTQLGRIAVYGYMVTVL